MPAPFLSVIIPAHNEAERLPASLAQLNAWLQAQHFTSEVLVVENASTDRTAEVVRQAMPGFPGLRLLQLEQGGKGNAVRSGMLAVEGHYRFMADADFSMPVEEISKFLPLMQAGVGAAIASREAPGAVRIGEPLSRHLVGRAYNLLVKTLALPGIEDSQCGFKCFSAEAAQAVFPRQQLTGWAFDVEILVIARELGFSVTEVPITWHYFPGSHVSLLRDSFKMGADLLQIRRNRRRGLYRG